jgi:2',3'-cyclic-nucleotide 2'-phosphodiesterase (5'-nucleotidase family)
MRSNFKNILFLISLVSALTFLECRQFKSPENPAEFLSVESRNISLDSTVTEDSSLIMVIAPYQKELEERMNVVIGKSAVNLFKGRPEAPLNNFVTDLMRKRASKEMKQPVDIALTNIGGLRSTIPKGPITLGKIYEVMPFENELVVIEFTGEQVKNLAQEIGASGGEPISGLQITFEQGQLTDVTIDGKPIIYEKKYSLVTTDYLSSPGRKRLSILGTVPRVFLGITLRQAIIDEVKEVNESDQQISARVENRIIIKE